MQGLLPEEAMDVLTGLGKTREEIEAKISDAFERILLKLWQGEELTKRELDQDIHPVELTALWSVTHRRAILPDTARQVLRRTGARGGQIKASKEWGTGAALRRMYRLGDVVDVKVQERGASKAKSAKQSQQ